MAMFFDKLSEICKENGTSPSAVVVALGMSKSNITRWKAGQTPKIETVIDLATYLGVDFWDLVDKEPRTEKLVTNKDDEFSAKKATVKKDDGSNVTFIKDEQLIRFPIIGSITAGYTGLAVEEHTGEFQVIPASFLHGPPENYFILHVKGNSMYPRLLSGDSVLVKRTPAIPNGKVGVVLYNGDEATVKKINYDEGKSIDLIPFNPEYQTKHIEGEDLNQCKILGEVVKLIRDM